MKNLVKLRQDRGVALLMVLGILSLLLIMAMSFSYQSQTERMAAGNHADTARARLLSESCMERILAGLAHNFDGTDPLDIYPPRDPGEGISFKTYNSGTYRQHYFINVDSTSIDWEGYAEAMRVDGFPNMTGLLEPSDDADKAKWVPILEDETATDPEDPKWKLLGRMAYLVLDESGKIDATCAVTPNHEPFTDTNGDGTHDANEHYFDVDGNGAYNTASVLESQNRITGGSLEEVVVDAGLLSNLPVVGGGTDKTRWFSLSHLLGVMGEAYYMTFGTHGYDIEAYLKDVPAPGSDVDTHRFDLSGYAWDPSPLNTSSAWDDAHVVFTGDDKVLWTGAAVDPQTRTGDYVWKDKKVYVDWVQATGGTTNFWDTTGTPPDVNPVAAPVVAGAGGIPWLQFMSGDTANNIPEQVAANIIDYCDRDSDGDDAPDDVPTSADTTGDGYPDVVGLERVPYLNEIAVDIAYQRQPDGTDPTKDQHVVTLTAYCELVNMYGAASPAVTVVLDMDVEFDRKWSAETGIPADAQNLTAEIDVASLAANSYHARFGSSTPQVEFIKTWTWGPTTGSSGGGSTKSRIAMTVTEIKAGVFLTPPSVTDDAELLDFVHITTDSDKTPNMSPASDAPPMQYFCTVEVEDPRANGNDSDWEWKDFDTVLVDSLDGQNSVADATSGDDTETQTDPAAGLSTAYVRNAPMQSLWELGAIHRGEAWRTVNLTKVGGSTGADYDDGDAGMLDQVKIGPQTIVRGKVNANSPCKAVWSEILSDIKYDDPYDSPGTGTTDPVTGGLSLDSLVGADDRVLPHRGGLAAVLAAIGTTDREREASLGKMANFLTTRQNIFTVIVAAQSVRDLGNIPDPGQGTAGDRYHKYVDYNGKDYYCAVVAEQRILATLYRDALTNEYRVERFEFLEE